VLLVRRGSTVLEMAASLRSMPYSA